MIKMRPICGVIQVPATPFVATGGIDEPALHRFMSFLCSKCIWWLCGFGSGRGSMNLAYDKDADASEQERALFMKYDGGFRSV